MSAAIPASAGAVLVLGNEPRVVVGICRSLSAHGLDVDVAVVGQASRALRSRAVRRLMTLPDADRASDLAPRILELVRTQGYDTVIPCSDTTLTALMACDGELRALAKVACPPPAVLASVIDKERTLEIAALCGVPVPARWTFDRFEAAERAHGLGFPLVAKPATKRTSAAFKVRHIESLDALRREFAADPEFGSKYMLQVYCSGYGVGIEVLIHDGQAVALFQHRRVRELPIRGGVSVAAAASELDPILVEHSLALLRGLAWRGVAMVEFRYDPELRKAWLMEVNGRFWGSLALSRAAGIDFPWYQWQLLHGETPAVPATYGTHVRMRWLAGDVRRVREAFTKTSASWSDYRRVLRQSVGGFLADFFGRTRDALWSWRDPGPGFWELVLTVFAIVKADVRGFARAIVPAPLVRRARDWLETRRRRKRAHDLGLVTGVPALPMHRPRTILFVCHGNIMRSALAHHLLRRLVGEAAEITISSAGVAASPGKKADERAIAFAATLDIDLSSHRATRLSRELAESADAIFVMDYENARRVLEAFPSTKGKVSMLRAVGPVRKFGALEISDPFLSDASAAEGSFSQVVACTRELAARLGV